jgi:hypothetical protein
MGICCMGDSFVGTPVNKMDTGPPALTTIVSPISALSDGELLSVTRRVNVEEPAVVGVPLIVGPLRVNPAGRLPVVTDQL